MNGEDSPSEGESSPFINIHRRAKGGYQHNGAEKTHPGRGQEWRARCHVSKPAQNFFVLVQACTRLKVRKSM